MYRVFGSLRLDSGSIWKTACLLSRSRVRWACRRCRRKRGPRTRPAADLRTAGRGASLSPLSSLVTHLSLFALFLVNCPCNYQFFLDPKDSIRFVRLISGVVGGGAGLVSKHRKVLGTGTIAATYAADLAIVTGCYCGNLSP